MSKPTVLVWDIETTELQGDRGHILAACVYNLNTKELTTFRADETDEPFEDKNLVSALVEKLATGDLWVTQYGIRFDLPFVQTRVAYWRGRGHRDLHFLPKVPHVDLWRTSKYKLAMRSNRLQSLADLLGRGRKTSLDFPLWRRAERGDRASMDKVVHHCQVDIRITANCYRDVRPLIAAHPHLGALVNGTKLSCPLCASRRTQRRGLYATVAGVRARVYCKACNGWSSAPAGRR